MKNDIAKLFSEIHGLEKYQLIDMSHPIPMYAGIDGSARYSLFIKTMTRPDPVKSSNIIDLFVGARTKRHPCGLTFSLNDESMLDQFVYFCEDLFESTKEVPDDDNASNIICARYLKWQKAFEITKDGLLPSNVIKGLLGELYFLKEKMIPLFGETKAIASWIGPDAADQDFVVDDTWYEVKSTVSGAEAVNISSVEQLDTAIPGNLVVIHLDKTSSTDQMKIRLNEYYNSIMNILEEEDNKNRLSGILLNHGYYPDERYDDYCFHYNGYEIYEVSSTFPCLRATSLPSSIGKVRYALYLNGLEQYLKEKN